MPKNIKDIDMVNSHPVILLNLCQKNKVTCNILKNYVENRDLILDSFGNNRKSVKEMFLTILNGGFKDIYSKDSRINNYLKLLEKEIIEIQKYFYSKDKRYFEKSYNYLGKNKLKYGQNRDHSCLLNVEIYTTKKVKNDKILSQFPALVSKTSIKYDQLSDFKRKNLKENYKSSEKLISHLGYDKNSYISFEIYEMLKSLGYRINIKRILEYRHSNFMKPYIDILFEKIIL